MKPSKSDRRRRLGPNGNLALGAAALILAAVATTDLPARAAPPSQAPQAAADLQLALSSVPVGPGKPPRLLDSRLAQLTEIHRRDGVVAMRRFATVNTIPLDELGRASVLIHENADADFGRRGALRTETSEESAHLAAQEALFGALEVPISRRVSEVGGEIRGRVANLVEAYVPVAGLRSLRALDGVRWVEPSLVPNRTVTSEGVGVINADTLQNSSVSFRPSGPVKVGVIDLGFQGHQALLGTELPANVTVNSFHPGGIEGVGEALLDAVHGTACAEIIHDVAPEAQLFFANFNTVSDNDAAVDWMISQDVDVISYSIGWTNAGPGDGRGPINQAVDRALNAGIEWVSSAGNDARDHWQGTYSDPDGDGIHNFAGSDESNAVFLGVGDEISVFLNWDDWFSSDQDYDLFILDAAGNVVAGSTNFQTGTQNPAEAAGFTAVVAGTYHVVITRFSATRNVELELFFRVAREMQYIVPAGSLTIPADTDGAVAVGATFWGDDVIESFSSQGPTVDGRTKPDISAPDGVSTRSYGDLGLAFFGTSASAPHTAGAIALMKSRFGVFSLEDIRGILFGRAVDRGIQGMDNIYGHGRLDVQGR